MYELLYPHGIDVSKNYRLAKMSISMLIGRVRHNGLAVQCAKSDRGKVVEWLGEPLAEGTDTDSWKSSTHHTQGGQPPQETHDGTVRYDLGIR